MAGPSDMVAQRGDPPESAEPHEDPGPGPWLGPRPGPGPGPGSGPGPGPGPAPGTRREAEPGPSATRLRAIEFLRRLGITVMPLAAGTCDHPNEEPGYKPSRRLRHLIRARDRTCSFPGCRRPAGQCDLDHTVPYESGGRTCECNLAPLCRRHHRCKQSSGWQLNQPEPGILVWTTPAGRTYTTTPTIYPA
jgi:hypothetical protein